MKIGEIIDKEKEKLFNDLLKDYIKEKELTKLLNKFKPRILDFKLIISLDDISDNKQLEINKDNQVPIDEANISKFYFFIKIIYLFIQSRKDFL